MRILRNRRAGIVLALAFAVSLLTGAIPQLSANTAPPALTQPVNLTPPAPAPAAQDFSDADFAQADQPELGNRTGGAARLTQEEWILIIAGALLLLLILIIIF